MKIHRRVTYGFRIADSVALPSKALCGASGKRTSKDDEVTCLACRKLMAKKSAP